MKTKKVKKNSSVQKKPKNKQAPFMKDQNATNNKYQIIIDELTGVC